MKRQLDEPALRSLARGCAVLGTGGGGDPHIGLLLALQALEEVGPTELVDLAYLPGEALIMPCGMVGAPTVHIEKIENGGEGAVLRDHIERLTGRTVAALMPAEIGGSNGLLPACWAGRMGLPVVDADGMGRAFPEIPQVTMHLAGVDPNPGVMTDERGNVLVFRAVSGAWMERLERAAAVEFGGAGAATEYIMTVAQARDGAAISGTFTLAIAIGDALSDAEGDPIGAVLAVTGGHRLMAGKVTDVERRTTKGFVRGSVEIEGLREDAGRLLRLEIQNENLVALEHGTVLASVPDLITVLDSETADAIPTERVRYGQRVTVIAMACAPIWRSPYGLRMAGPRAFGYDFDYVAIEELAGAGA
ncbi:MAG TPA: DUF917 domain-containing protein [Streptosporangiaceae bacterium]|nr:DUF917 domain-containing protein [Streptosporangiaceae bacterium]